MRPIVFFLASVAAGIPMSARAMELSFSWGPTKACFDSRSPPIAVSDAPAGTKKLRVHMTDLDAPDYPHGGGVVSFHDNGQFPYGAFHYKGPCPPSPHTYRMTAEALGDKGRVLATATAEKRFP